MSISFHNILDSSNRCVFTQLANISEMLYFSSTGIPQKPVSLYELFKFMDEDGMNRRIAIHSRDWGGMLSFTDRINIDSIDAILSCDRIYVIGQVEYKGDSPYRNTLVFIPEKPPIDIWNVLSEYQPHIYIPGDNPKSEMVLLGYYGLIINSRITT